MSDVHDNPPPRISRRGGFFSIGRLVQFVVLAVVAWGFFEWTVNRIEVPVGKSLLLQYKGLFGFEKRAAAGQLAKRGEVGILEEMVGPGRHFYCPLWWRRTVVDDVVVEPGEVMIVTSKVGVEDPAASASNRFLVEGDIGSTTAKGTLRKVYGPGRYRINTYAYDTRIEKVYKDQQGKVSGWVEIPTGCVGVVTNQTDNEAINMKAGIQHQVLPPGAYPMNPAEQRVDIVEIGFRERSIITGVEQEPDGSPRLDENGEPTILPTGEGGISFPSKDGFTIHMDFTAVWGIMPEQAADVVRTNGNIVAVENRVVVPLIESICRNEGSKLGAVELLIGDSRLRFQQDTAKTFEQRLRDGGVELQYALVRYIYIPKDVREPIQRAFIADELKLTRDQEQLTARTEATLREAEKTVELETERIKVETEKEMAEVRAQGAKKAAETKAETMKKVAEIAKQTAQFESDAVVLLAEATTGAEKLLAEAKASRFKLAVEAFGNGEAFNQWTFATGLPQDIELQTLYAGEGTFWTDLKSFQDALLGRQAAQQKSDGESAPKSGTKATSSQR
jgi:regulator of protease activity HflC (stomatin/prohibitin superfamily)